MTSRKKILKEAKSLFKASLKNNLIDENKVKKITKLIASQKRAESLKLLKFYKRLIDQKIAQEQLLIETPTAFKQLALTKKLMAKTGVRKIIYKTNPKLILGARVKHGDWIWDSTLDAKLNQITQSQ